MMNYLLGKYDVAVIGAGHAGIEACLASARLGRKTVLLTINLDSIGNMPCNPSIGGTAKGHLVREVDALGGEMGKAADKVFLQNRMLNLGKGPAVHSLRIQADRRKYQTIMKNLLEKTDNLDIKQTEIKKIRLNDGEYVLTTNLGGEILAKAVVISTGTYLNGRIIIGETNYPGGPDGLFPAIGLTESLSEMGISFRRFKTGTPPRILKSTVDLSKLEEQLGDEEIVPFSFENEGVDIGKNKASCYIAYTNEKTHEIIRQNLDRSPIYSGEIKGVGPRYCPSIESKIVTFPDKERHQLFLEPVGEGSEEMYLGGFSSSMPEDIQIQMVHSMSGFENAKIMRTAYAIEYDCIDPLQLYASLEFKDYPGLFGAGQFNGTSGYEEAAAQGIIAGINAARFVSGLEPVVLDRSSSYIGTLIDDLVTKGTVEPYRIMTSRSEYRLLLRQDNADVRLTPLGHSIGLVSDERYERFCKKQQVIQDEENRLKSTFIPPTDALFEILDANSSSHTLTGISLAELVKRPELSYEKLAPVDNNRPDLPKYITDVVEINIRYEGYIKRQYQQVEQFKKSEMKRLPKDFDYNLIDGLRIEAKQKLNLHKPLNIGQASRISGVSPADIFVLMIYFKYL